MEGDVEARGLAYIDLDKAGSGMEMLKEMLSDSRPWLAFTTSYEDDYISSPYTRFFPTLIRAEGYIEGNEFHPIIIDSGSYVDVETGDEVSRIDKLQYLDRQNKIKWSNLFTHESPSNHATETIYAWYLLGYHYDYDPITVRGVTYDSISEFLTERGDDHMPNDLFPYGRSGNLWETLIVRDSRCEDIYGSFYYTIAIRCHPLHYAMLRLFPTYIVSAMLIGVAVALMWRKVKVGLLIPMSYITYAVNEGARVYPSSTIDEIYRLETYVADTHQQQAET